MDMPKLARLFSDQKAPKGGQPESLPKNKINKKKLYIFFFLSHTKGSGRPFAPNPNPIAIAIASCPISRHNGVATKVLVALLAKYVIKLSLTTNSTPRQDSIITQQNEENAENQLPEQSERIKSKRELSVNRPKANPELVFPASTSAVTNIQMLA